MKYRFVCPTYNNFDEAISLIERARKEQSIEQIIFVDNNSSLEDKNSFKEYLGNNILIELKDNFGFDYACNEGLQYIEKIFHDAFAFVCNTDVIFTDKEINGLVSILKNNHDVAIAAPKMFLSDGSQAFSARNLPSFKTMIIFNIQTIKISYFKKSLNTYRREVRSDCEIVGSVNSGLLAINMTKAKEVGYFDKNIFMYFDEDAFSSKLLSRGFLTAFSPNLSVIHNHNFSKNNNRANKKIRQSEFYFFKKYISKNFFKICIYRFFVFIHILELKIIKILVSIKHKIKS